MRTIRLGMAFAWLGASVLGAAQVANQGGVWSPQGPEPELGITAATFKSAVDLVTLNVTVTDVRNRHVSGLGRDDFQVLEDGVSQPLRFFAASEVPLDVTLLVDTSSSMRDKLPLVQQAAHGFIKSLRPADRASVVGFTTRVLVLQPFTHDKAALRSAITGITAAGNTALYTAIYVALDQLTRARPLTAEVRRSAMIVLTDGEDTASAIQFNDVLDRARRAGVAIYPIALIPVGDATKLVEGADRRFTNGSDNALATLARETGATPFFPTEPNELDGVYQSVADELSVQYALGYVPPAGATDGGYRHLVVRVPSRPELKSRTRAGYYASGPVRAANTR